MEEKQTAPKESMTIKPDLARRIMEELGENVYLCYQCVKCTNGCPVSEFFDWQPNQIMRAVQLGQEDIALESQTPWLCAACQTCTTRCPQGLDINGIMEFLTRESITRGFDSPVPQMKDFSEAFMREVRLWGRAYEPGLMAEMKLRNPKTLFDDLDIYVQMLKKRKVSIIPKFGRPPSDPKPIPEAADSVAYYPGCSLHSTAAEFDGSARAVAVALDLHLIEPKGWVCCGSSAAHRIDPEAATALPMQNLSLIEQYGFKEVTMPCAACFNRHKAAQFEIRHDEQHKTSLDEATNHVYQDTVQVNTLIETILQHVGATGVNARVKKPLAGLRVVPYYGCLLTRPPQVTEVKHPDNPTDMDELLSALGAEVVDWSYKTLCCGAAHALTRPDIVRTMSGNLIDHAREAGADAIAVACPLCHMNLDTRQMQLDHEDEIPILYFTQLMALALELPLKAAALNKNVVDPRPLLRERGIL
jgi:heterodisulfide reductase subunit B